MCCCALAGLAAAAVLCDNDCCYDRGVRGSYFEPKMNRYRGSWCGCPRNTNPRNTNPCNYNRNNCRCG